MPRVLLVPFLDRLHSQPGVRMIYITPAHRQHRVDDIIIRVEHMLIQLIRGTAR